MMVSSIRLRNSDGWSFQHFHHALLRLLDNRSHGCVVDLGQLTLDILAAQIRRHDDDGVLEVHHPTFVVRQPSVIEHLQQDVEHIGMSLLYLIEQHHAVRLAAYSLGELTALVVANVSWRRSDETRDAELLLILAHVDTRHHLLIVEQDTRPVPWPVRSCRHPWCRGR
jgi:hypothetical protein